MENCAIFAENLSVSLKGKSIVSNLNLSVERGSFHGIIGRNGAGKTTLFNTLVGFRKATAGRVSLLGENPWPRNPALLSRIGIQHQRPSFFVKMSLSEHLNAVTDLFQADRSYVHTLVDALELTSSMNTRVESLSGGERQRLAIASALVHKPEILFLDEPTAGLDPSARRVLIELLHNTDIIQATTLYTTHYLEEAERLCDTVSIMDGGTILRTANPHRLIAEANLGTKVLLPAALGQEDLVKAAVGNVRITIDGLEYGTADAAGSFVALQTAGVRTAGAHVDNGSLEDVFLALTGKKISK